MTDETETLARAINAEPWEPPPGVVKRRCLKCRYIFAVLIEDAEKTACCPDCARPGAQPRRRALRAP